MWSVECYHFQLEGCIVWNDTIQYSPKAVRYPCTICLLCAFDDGYLSRAYDWVMSALSATLLIILNFIFILLLFHISVVRRHYHCGILLISIRNIVHLALRKFLVGTVLVQIRTAQVKYFELILMVKMETRHPIEGQFCSEFPAICSHCRVMTAWSRQTWTLLCWKFVKFIWREIGEIVCYLPDKPKNLVAYQTRYTADCAQHLPGPAPNNVPTVL